MSPQQKGTNWTIIALIISTGVTVWYTGRAAGKIESEVTSLKQQVQEKNAKDSMQDARLLGHDINLSSIQTDVSALKDGRYPVRPVPVFPNKFNGAGVGN